MLFVAILIGIYVAVQLTRIADAMTARMRHQYGDSWKTRQKRQRPLVTTDEPSASVTAVIEEFDADLNRMLGAADPLAPEQPGEQSQAPQWSAARSRPARRAPSRHSKPKAGE